MVGFNLLSKTVSKQLTAPLLKSQSEATWCAASDRAAAAASGGDNSGDADAEPPKKLTIAERAKSAAVTLLTLGGIGAYAASFVAISGLTTAATTAATAVLAAASGVCVLTSPLVWTSEWKLNRLPMIRSEVNGLKSEAYRLLEQVDILHDEEEDLKLEAEAAQDVYVRLDKLVREKNLGNVEELVELVHENRQILKEMKEYLRDAVVQDVVRAVIQSDLNNDGIIDSHEAKILEAKLQIAMEARNIVFDVAKFHRAVGLSPSIIGVMGVVKRLLPNTDSGRRSSFYDKAQSDSENEGDDYSDTESDSDDEDHWDMFYISVEEEAKLNRPGFDQMCSRYETKKKRRPTLVSISPDLEDSLRALKYSINTVDEDQEVSARSLGGR